MNGPLTHLKPSLARAYDRKTRIAKKLDAKLAQQLKKYPCDDCQEPFDSLPEEVKQLWRRRDFAWGKVMDLASICMGVEAAVENASQKDIPETIIEPVF